MLKKHKKLLLKCPNYEVMSMEAHNGMMTLSTIEVSLQVWQSGGHAVPLSKMCWRKYFTVIVHA